MGRGGAHREGQAGLKRDFDICVLPGDGIGVEVTEATLPVLEKVQQGFALRFNSYPAGAHHYKRTGEALPETTFAAAKAADAILFGAMGWPQIRYPDGTEIAPQLDLRFRLELFAGVRPARAIPGIPLPLPMPIRAREHRPGGGARVDRGPVASRGKGVIEGIARRATPWSSRKGIGARARNSLSASRRAARSDG